LRLTSFCSLKLTKQFIAPKDDDVTAPLTGILVASTGGYQATFVAAFIVLGVAAALIVPIKKVR
jgi:hypothetical protein